jgi:hypothetical protein
MRARTLIILAGAAVLAAIVAAVIERERAPRSPADDQGLLYADLATGLNEIRVIEIGSPDADDRLDLERSEAGWVVTQKNGYRADPGRIRQLLLRLAEARILEVKTSNPELYGRLGVGDPGEEDGGTLLAVGPPADARLIVGRQETRAGSGTYVRREGEAQSYLVGEDLSVGRDPLDWLDKDLFDVDGMTIEKMIVEHADGEKLELVRVGERLVVAGIPEGRELSSPGASQPMTRGLSPLRFDDVVPAGESDLGPQDATVRYHLTDGRRITARAWRREDQSWVAFDVDLGPVGKEPTPETAAAEEAREPEEAGEDTGETPPQPEVMRADPEDVARRDAELAGWVYRIPTYKYEQIVRRMDDLLKPVED